jgi:5-methylcytosine-specific restriction endonuclease McrA
MSRQEFSVSVKRAAAKRANGHCEECTRRLSVGDYHYDHAVADQLGGAPTLDNCRVLCRSCHRAKTRSRDLPQIAKAKRREQRHMGIRKSGRPMPGSRASGWKQKVGGGWERRS